MIHDASTFDYSGGARRLRADLCVIGAGAGGAAVAMVAAEAGLRVVILEAGEFLTPADMSQREDEMLPRLYWESGARTTADRGVRIHQGRGVGGSTLHNLNLCKRIPTAVLEGWQRSRGLEHLPLDRWRALYEEVEALLSVGPVPEELLNRHNKLLQAACGTLGWRGGFMQHNRTGCLGSGFCEVGCAYDAKNNAAKVLVPRAVKAGAIVLTQCQAVRLRHAAGRVTGVEAVAMEPGRRVHVGAIEIEAPRVCVAASATATPALLLRSNVPAPTGSTGDGLRVHPAVVVAGDFDDEVVAWRGVPQSYECTEWLEFPATDDPTAVDDKRLWIVPAFAHPVATSTMLPGFGAAHGALMERYAHFAVLTAMLHDHTAGRVRPSGDLGLRIDYWPDEADRRQLTQGFVHCARLLFAAGARRVVVPTNPLRIIERGQPFEDLADLALVPGLTDLTAVHPMASVPMGDDPPKAAVDSRGKHHHLEGLWVGDGSLFPTSIGGPPQLSIYALGLHVGRGIVARG